MVDDPSANTGDAGGVHGISSERILQPLLETASEKTRAGPHPCQDYLQRMSAVLAHELHNPLASLKGHAQLLQASLEPGTEAQQRATRVVHEALRLELLVFQVLQFARAGRVERKSVELNSLLRDIVREETDGRIVLQLTQGPLHCAVDPLRLAQALASLIRNALQSSPDDGVIEVELMASDSQVSITVRDRGAGILPGHESLIFEPFYTDQVWGLGLELTVCRQIVELHQGTLTGRNRSDGGAEFCVSLPR